MKKTLRGIEVDISEEKRLLTIELYRPINNVFSLSDKIISYLPKGYTLIVDYPGGVMRIEDLKKCFLKESVQSKFRASPPWYRYWFPLPKKEAEGQYKLF